MLFDYRELAEISLRIFCPDSSKEDSIEVIIGQNKAKEKLTLFLYNFTYHALIDEWSEKDLIRYGTNFEIYSKETIINHLCYLIEKGIIKEISKLVDKITQAKIKKVTEKVGTEKSKPIFEELNEKIDYDSIKITLAKLNLKK